MNRKQYFTVAIFLLVLLFYLPLIIRNPVLFESSTYFSVRNGILSAIMWLVYPLMILFLVLASLEPDKKYRY